MLGDWIRSSIKIRSIPSMSRWWWWWWYDVGAVECRWRIEYDCWFDTDDDDDCRLLIDYEVRK